MKKFYSFLGALLVATGLFAQTNYTCTFLANVPMDSVQVKNTVSGEAKMLYYPDNVITLQKVEKQDVAIATVANSAFLQQTANNIVAVNVETASLLNLTLYSANGTVVARYANAVSAGQYTFQVGASAGVYVLVASANDQTASLKLSLLENAQAGIFEVATAEPVAFLKSADDVITFNEGEEFEFTGYYKKQIDVKNAVVTGNMEMFFTLNAEPSVYSTQAVDVTQSTATVGGKVTDENGTTVTERGVCWATTENPTINDNKKISGKGVGDFSVSITGLTDATTYYFRAYAVNSVGIAYGETVLFTTETITAPTVITNNVFQIIATSARVGITVESDNGAKVTDRGICWAKTDNPTVSDNKLSQDYGTGVLTILLSSLEEATTYYVRAYAENSAGIAYGETISFTTGVQLGDITKENGAIKSEFSVSETKKVYFSQGNLSYKESSDTWEFFNTQHQYNKYTYFNWGASGYNGISPTTSDLYAFPKEMKKIEGTNYDWGVYNKITNGGNVEGLWRTLTYTEWNYLLNNRKGADTLCFRAWINMTRGLLLLPDNWTTPNTFVLTHTKSPKEEYSDNHYSLEEWSVMESYGAVFLPCAGYRIFTSTLNHGLYGYYWSTANYGEDQAYFLYFDSNKIEMTYEKIFRRNGLSVRLVQDVE